MTGEKMGEGQARDVPAAVVDDRFVEELVSRAEAEGVQLAGEGGLLQQLTKRLLESALEGEMIDHLNRCPRPPGTPLTAPDRACSDRGNETPQARPREISSRSAGDNRRSHRRRGTGRTPPERFIRSRTVDGCRRISRASTFTACPDRHPRHTSSLSSGDNATPHHPLPHKRIMKCCNDPVETPVHGCFRSYVHSGDDAP